MCNAKTQKCKKKNSLDSIWADAVDPVLSVQIREVGIDETSHETSNAEKLPHLRRTGASGNQQKHHRMEK
jgi:hypothetical protein